MTPDATPATGTPEGCPLRGMIFRNVTRPKRALCTGNHRRSNTTALVRSTAEIFRNLEVSQRLPFAPKGDACGHGITSSITPDIATHIAYSIGHSITTETILSCRFQYHQCLNIVMLLLLKSSFLLMTPSM